MSSALISITWVVPKPSLEPSISSIQTLNQIKIPFHISSSYRLRPRLSCRKKVKATLDEKESIFFDSEKEKAEPSKEVLESVKLLKNAAKTRKVSSEEIISAFSVIEKSKIDPSAFFQTLGGTNSPGRTWMLVFTAKKNMAGGSYFPLTAVQRFDAAGKRIENGVYLGPIGYLTFEGKLSWKNRILAFVFEKLRIKFGPFNTFEFIFKGKDEREPNNKDPFFIWFYVDEEIAVARGKSGGTAFWVRCQHLSK